MIRLILMLFLVVFVSRMICVVLRVVVLMLFLVVWSWICVRL